MEHRLKTCVLIAVGIIAAMGAAGFQIMFGNTRVEKSIDRLFAGDEESRKAAAKELKDLAKQSLSVKDGLRVLQASFRPPIKIDAVWDHSGEFLLRLLDDPMEAYVPIIEEHYGDLDDRARAACLSILSELEGAESATSYARLVQENGWPGHNRSLYGFKRDPHHRDILFPTVWAACKNDDQEITCYEILLAYAENGALPRSEIDGKRLIDAYHRRVEQLRREPKSEEERTNREVQVNSLGLLLDLMAYFKSTQIRGELQKALSFQESELRLWAISSLLKIGAEVPAEPVRAVATDARTRRRLVLRLRQLDQIHRIPPEYMTAEALAESDMVNWLEYPTELGCAPDEIELMDVLTVVDEDQRSKEYYLYRFRMKEPHWAAKDEWQAGVAGPYSKDRSQPVPDETTDTFSKFEKWDSQSPREHFESILGTLQEWKSYRLRNSG